jgi:hypothetical protein
VDYDPISVALKFGFLAVLYLFLLVIARGAMKDLRRTVSPGSTPRRSSRRHTRSTPGSSSNAAAGSSGTSAST